MTKFQDYLTRKTTEYGDRFDSSDLARSFVRYFESGERIKVKTVYGDQEYVRTGTVGVTTGWRPTFLLMARSNSQSSSDVLSDRDQVIAVKVGQHYVAVSTAGSRLYHRKD